VASSTFASQSTLCAADTLAGAQSTIASGDDEIQDLCTTFASSKAHSKEGYGFLEDDHKRYYLYPTLNDAHTLNVDEPASLDNLLRRTYQPPLNRRQRYTLALTLASSFVQLWESSWLPPASWSRCDICFPRDADHSDTILLDRPFLSRRLTSSSTKQPDQANSPSGIPFLGVLLLELCFGSLVEEAPTRQQYPSQDPAMSQFFDQLVAVEWLREVGDEAGPDYAEAATWCLIGSRSLGGGDDWRRMLFEKVVQPLEHCYSYLNPQPMQTNRPPELSSIVR
jgi:hypothetical protein